MKGLKTILTSPMWFWVRKTNCGLTERYSVVSIIEVCIQLLTGVINGCDVISIYVYKK